MTVDRTDVSVHYADLQSRLCTAFEEFDGTSRFTSHRWDRDGGGGGTTRVLQGDGPIEKAAINVSTVWGSVPEQLSDRLAARAEEFFATGISMIFHPANPHAPAMHANLRYFATDDGTAWFGGGMDLTPSYLYEEDAAWFHGTIRAVCDAHPVARYREWKHRCDEYFYLPHRGEARGIGGIFYDHLTENLDAVDAFQRDLGAAITRAYLPILERRVDTPFTPDEERWHLQRRGRYAEFNLAIDRGTRFGLETGARTESVLASLPPRVRWDADVEVKPLSREAELVDVLREPRSWA